MIKKYIIAPIAAFFLPLAASAQDLGSNMLNTAGKNAGYKGGVQIEDVIGTVINTVLAVLGIIFLTLTVYAGYMWMTAGGDEGKVEKAKETISRSVIGLVIVLAAYAITYFVLSKLITATVR
jgi:hypothetical protein